LGMGENEHHPHNQYHLHDQFSIPFAWLISSTCFNFYHLFNITYVIIVVATPIWRKCEVATHTSENGTWESSGTSKNSEHNCKGQNTLHWGVLYTVEKFLKCRCPKWLRMSHLDISSTSYGRKKGRESNWQFDSRPLKVGNRPDYGACRWSATHRWKALEESYNFDVDVVLIQVRGEKLWSPKSWESKLGQFRDSILGVPGKRTIWMQVWRRVAENTIWGMVVASFESGPWWIKWVQGCLSQHWKCAEWILTNLLVRFGCKSE
jgi:hypothetical protein